ncbi:MAG: hypothetical protein J7L53_08385 [Deltaproteobacteria bacterium]|nr:hypothetical protein [Deltaproteobacteria bacterium]
MMGDTAINKVIEEFSHLPLEDKKYVVEIMGKQLIEAKREAISQRAKEAASNFKKGLVKEGSLKNLYEDLESD